MGELLEGLRRLQTVELKLAGFRRDEAAKTRRTQSIQRRIDKLAERIGINQAAARDRQIKIDALTLDVAAREEASQKHREGLGKAKTNKEYAAILTALNTEKADTIKIENGAFSLMEEIQQFDASRGEIDAERAEVQQRLDRAKADLKAHRTRVQPEVDTLGAQRDAIAEQISPTAYSTFARVAARHEGEAMVPIDKANANREEYVCGGCHIHVTLEVVSALRARDDLQLCTACGRILFLDNSSI